MDELENLRHEIYDLHNKLQFLLDGYVQCEDGAFTFPDGDTWWQTGREPKP